MKNKYINCKIAPTAKIMGDCILQNCTIGPHTKVTASTLTDCTISKGCIIGPFAHIHTNSKIQQNCIIGNFVEIKNSLIKQNTKIKHLCYVGDAIVGTNCNIGCGVVFANYNGKTKSKTIIKNGCFIGSNSTLIAPLTVREQSFVCAGTVLTKSTKKQDFVIARQRETIKPNLATKYLEVQNE